MVSIYLSKEAWIRLNELPPPDGAQSQRERDFCTAVVILDQQPLTEGRLDDVEKRLQGLIAADDGDEIAWAAQYLQGRIWQIYRAVPDVTKAAGSYRRLIARADAGHWAGLARTKLAVLTLYVIPAESRQARIEAAAALIEGTDDGITVRDLHRLLAGAIMFFNLPPGQALEHLLAADQFGGLTGNQGADQLVQIAELAWDAEQPELSARYYERLREEYPRDARTFLHDQRRAGAAVPLRREDLNGR